MDFLDGYASAGDEGLFQRLGAVHAKLEVLAKLGKAADFLI